MRLFLTQFVSAKPQNMSLKAVPAGADTEPASAETGPRPYWQTRLPARILNFTRQNMIAAQLNRSPARALNLDHEAGAAANRLGAWGGFAFADPAQGGITSMITILGAHRTTGGSSRKNRKPGDCEPSVPNGA